MWNQIYDPLGSPTLSTIAAALPVVTLLVLIASGKVKAHIAAVIALIGQGIAARRGGRFLPDRLDRAERHFPLPGYGRNRAL
jgi:hypothetical protein